MQTGLIKPAFLFLELTNHCNMHCTFCPSDELQKPRQHVAEADAVSFIRQVAALGLQRPIQFNVLGEPLLNKKVYDYIALCEELGIEVLLITNISLLSEDRLDRIFRHHNVVLVLSLQTPTAESYTLRQYQKIPSIEEYLPLVLNAVIAKFRAKSRSRIEIHVASEIPQGQVQSDAQDGRLWSVFKTREEQAEFLRSYIDQLNELSGELSRDWPGFYHEELSRIRDYFRAEFMGGRMELQPDRILSTADDPIESEFWGWMFAPNAFLRIKRFGLWTKQDQFLRKHLSPNQFIYVEERTEPLRCEMAGNFSMLADGSFSLCCLDYEGEMPFGNIHTSSMEAALRSPLRLATVENAMLHEVCRRCMGNVFVFDTSPQRSGTQIIDKYGFGWHGYEPEMHGCGGRWSKGAGKLYFYPRIETKYLDVEFYSPFPDDQEFTIDVDVQEAGGEFRPVHHGFFFGRENRTSRQNLDLVLEPFRLYRATLSSPVFSPKERYGSADTRLLGLAVVSLELLGTPAKRPPSELVQITRAVDRPARAMVSNLG